MYRMINTCPELTEAERAELKAAAARELYIILTQLGRENEE